MIDRHWPSLLRAPLLRAQHFATEVARTARLMVGVPDYDAYVQHRQSQHPGEPIMSYDDFFKDRQSSRYAAADGKVSRCC